MSDEIYLLFGLLVLQCLLAEVCHSPVAVPEGEFPVERMNVDQEQVPLVIVVGGVRGQEPAVIQLLYLALGPVARHDLRPLHAQSSNLQQ